MNLKFWQKVAKPGVYTVLPTKVSKETYEEILRLVKENKGNFIIRFINDKDERIDDLVCDAKGFTHER